MMPTGLGKKSERKTQTKIADLQRHFGWKWIATSCLKNALSFVGLMITVWHYRLSSKKSVDQTNLRFEANAPMRPKVLAIRPLSCSVKCFRSLKK